VFFYEEVNHYSKSKFKIMSKVAIVTGGVGLLGKAIAKHFLAKNINVVVADIDVNGGNKFELTISNQGLKFIQTDISDESSVKNLISKTIEQFGRIDILVNNGAIANPYFKSAEKFEDVSLDEWKRYLDVNLTSVFLCSKYATPHLRQNDKKSAIINIASTRALMSEKNTEGYAATKGGIVSMTHAMACSLGPHIRVNCISPGWIDDNSNLTIENHEQHMVGRVGKPEDIAQMVYFLSNEEQSGFVTGQNFVVDGGMTKKMIYE
jgi:NAD(P)-dependent dehydrogenase (short-subunit alcohol dehydrogenase family)